MEHKQCHNHSWTFQRVGGLDQVVLATPEDILHLDELDHKLWVALSCPSSGLEFDERTLTLLDRNKDGRIRIPEVVKAVKWVSAHLNNLDSLINNSSVLPLSAINTDTDEGKRLYATAKAILVNINKAGASYLTQDDVSQSAARNSGNLFNGDGVLPASPKFDEDIQSFIKNALSVMGGVKDASGLDGVNNAIATAFMTSIQAWLTWRHGVGSVATPFGDDTPEAWRLLDNLKAKIDDYFLRSELASYAPQAQQSLNVDEKYIVPAENGLLEDKVLAELPLSKIEADRPLDLSQGLNPIWREKVERFAQLIKPFIANASHLSRQEWLNIQAILSPYAQAVTSKPALVKVDTTIPPTSSIDQLGEVNINKILQSDVAERFKELANKDSSTPAAAEDVAAVERLVIYHKHLYRLLMNFVSFYDFFDLKQSAAFQEGHLFIDGRCCTLCVRVSDIAKHTTLANYSELFLLYCECTRKTPATDGTPQTMTIAAAMTAGNGDLLIEGRNGIFIDKRGNDWDAKVVKVITKPISITQAVWDPYRRMGRLITDQINKWASSKDAALTDSSNKILQGAETNATTTQPTAAPKFDIGRNVGIFAAIGLAIGAIGTALASIAQALFELHWWQFPIVILSLFLLVSGPSVIMAWLKLRQRTLGPLLEASGWAINGKVSINFFLGGELTSKAELPKNASRSLIDPMKKKKKPKLLLVFTLALLVGAAATGGWFWYQSQYPKTSEAQPSTPTEAAMPVVESATPQEVTETP